MKTNLSYCVKTLFCLFIFCAIIISCKDDEVVPENYIAEFKGDDWRQNIGMEVTLEAYLALEPELCLYYDLNDRLKNAKVEEDRYLRVSTPSGVGLPLGEQFHGAKVSITGIVREDPADEAELIGEWAGDEYLAMLEVLATPIIIEESEVEFPSFVSLCALHPDWCTPMPIGNDDTYVLIFSGGIDAGSAHMRYWNDMVFFYITCTWFQGVNPNNIRIVYKDGVDEDGYMPVHYAATVEGVQDAFDWFDERIGLTDKFVLFVTNHGGHNYADSDGDELDSDDEAIYYYNENTRIKDDLLADLVNDLAFGEFIGILEPCFGGGLIRDLSGPNRVIMSASTENEVSWGGHSNYGSSYDLFTFYFTSALAGQFPDGTPVDADLMTDGKISMAEAYAYATANDYADEHPQIESDGDGIPHGSFEDESGTLHLNMFLTD